MDKKDMAFGFIVRQAEPRDTDAMEEICRLSFDGLYGYFAIRSLHSSDHILVSKDGQKVVGFAVLKSVHIGKRARLGNILWLAVHPELRRKGVASGLIEASMGYFKDHGMNTVYVSVRKGNSAALCSFERKGFRRLDFHELFGLKGRRVLEVYSKMHIVPGEIVLTATAQ
jgi:ribosomal protein S18 acetylase RimI-like enzyme